MMVSKPARAARSCSVTRSGVRLSWWSGVVARTTTARPLPCVVAMPARPRAGAAAPRPPFGVEGGDEGGAAQPVDVGARPLEDGAAAVVVGLRADQHRLDAPADRLRGVGSRQVLVAGG